MFIDKVEISIRAGNGGNGHVSFLRDKMTQRGGPNGGDGGRGGDIVFVGSTRVDNLIDFRFTHKFVAQDGVSGKPGCKDGSDGADKEIFVPLGTKIYKAERTAKDETDLLADITAEGQRWVALKGGAGGRGNTHFATSRRQTPNFSHDGIKVKEYKVILELESIADVGIIGFPNAGKSTFLSLVTRANPKIANYPFTTLHPNIGVMAAKGGRAIVLADIPGLVEGASEGVGLGIDFLKHINRTRILVHMVDVAETDGRDAVSDFDKINHELAQFSVDLIEKPQIVVLNKVDSVADEARVEKVRTEITKRAKARGGEFVGPLLTSCATRVGVDELVAEIERMCEKFPRVVESSPVTNLEEAVDKNAFEIVVEEDGVFRVEGGLVDNLIRGIVLSDTESAGYFHRRLDKSGVIAALRHAGMKDGDTVRIADTEFVWEE